jgi:2-keto-3-deoxy-L-rhamnonate aldolase RhmA
MNGKNLRQNLHDGACVYGTLITSASPRWSQTISGLGLDFVFIDNEHTPFDRQNTAWMCQVYAALGLAPLVRIPSPDPFLACMALDGGAHGIIAPYIETPAQVRALMGSVRYRPLKGIRLQELLAGTFEPDPELRRYLEDYNTNNLLVINIESVPALENLDDILSVEGLDAVLIGPHDLSISLGIAEQYTHPNFLQAVEMIITTARRHCLGAGLHATYINALEQEIVYAKMGANLFVHQGDLMSIRYNLRNDINRLKQAMQVSPPDTLSGQGPETNDQRLGQ